MELIISNINKKFFNNSKECTFSLDVPDLKITSSDKPIYILGHNGSGKSVFFKLLTGELEVTKGKIQFLLENEKVNNLNVAIVRQNAENNLAMNLTVEENIIVKLDSKSLITKLFPKIKLKEKISSILKNHNGLDKKTEFFCKNLSGGQKQSLALLSTAIQNPKILCLDEFLSATDVKTTLLLNNFIKNDVNNSSTIIFIITHNIETALKEASRILILKEGKLVHDIEPNSILWHKDKIVEIIMN